ncbi:MAG TPA: hypothetical protein VFU49_09535 [Ktedonobacteraceae bacterium]|nr:hypothetical protein [Ktedonobacteraceae bacterium]
MARQRIIGEQGKREAPSQAQPPPLAPTIPPHDCLSRRIFFSAGYSMGSASIPKKS